MSLVEKIKEIARQQKIPESELILDELNWFMKEHEGHGRWEIVLRYDKKDDRVNGIYLECLGDEVKFPYQCSHCNPETTAELTFSAIYLNEPTSEIEMQKLRREGKIDNYGNKIG